MKPGVFTVTLRPLPQANDPSGDRRLRMGLKLLLRAFGLRCVEVRRQLGVIHDTAERIGAVLAIRWEWVDLDQRRISIPAEVRMPAWGRNYHSPSLAAESGFFATNWPSGLMALKR